MSEKTKQNLYLSDYQDFIANTRRLTPKTVNEYMLDLSFFFRFILIFHKNPNINLDEKINQILKETSLDELTNEIITSVTWNDVQRFMSFYVGVLKNNERSQKRKLVSIRRFFDYLLFTNKIAATPIGDIDIRTPKKQPISLTENQIITIIEPILKSYEGKFKERDKAIIILFLELGLRLSELVSINLEDIENDAILIKGKGKKERILPLNETCISAINTYLKVRPKSYEIKTGHRQALFLSRLKQRISTRGVQLIIDKLFLLANLNNEERKFTTHKLRHSFATILADKGVSIHDIQDFLGHENLATTSIYVNSNLHRLKEVKDKNPILKNENI
ncbi:Site-specific recombinase XerD [Desulfonispora thiosulfatigenes DSM 11270]|uniref:Site-specific recombinase XerD n=1 Tax=Desulfonispora thiosulfatigenes DSM 11270 TaxID=656914 RepID=A0A1W1VQ53_DESTI|nr:tyrosine-type recombinase/integrase [Desulfonispora thiosulfatigenes]SMB95211.1 Site-specific recombinase XerD [Desulfonispora thiosulfatigenes DSM 11270]